MSNLETLNLLSCCIICKYSADLDGLISHVRYGIQLAVADQEIIDSCIGNLKTLTPAKLTGRQQALTSPGSDDEIALAW